MDAIKMLEQDHAAVKKLFARFEKTTTRGTPMRKRLVKPLVAELDVHARVEEEIFHPAMRGAGDVSAGADASREGRADGDRRGDPS